MIARISPPSFWPALQARLARWRLPQGGGKRPPCPPRRALMRPWQRWSLFALIAALLLGLGGYVYFSRGLMTIEELRDYRPPLPTTVRGHDGTPVQSFARERRVALTYDEYPPLVVRAFISAEDKTFFSHQGIDVPGLIGAIGDYAVKSVTGGRARGGSTITQQVAKAMIGDTSYSVLRKIPEAILAFRLERALSKQQILELYLNQIFLGRNAYGVQAAARAYFDKDVGQLTLPDVAYLAVLPKAPANYDPVRNTQRALDRRNYVLREMRDNGYINEPERAAAAAAPLGTIVYGSNVKYRDQGGYFMEDVRRFLIERFGEDAKAGDNSVYGGGLWVRSSMDPRMQDAMAEALRDGMMRFDAGRGWSDPRLSIDLAGNWRGRLVAAPLGPGYPDWSKAVVLAKSGNVARIGLPDGSEGQLPAWAASQPKRGTGGAAFGHLRPGMLILVKREGDHYALRSTPAIGGGMIAQEVHSGRVLAMQGGFDVITSSYNRATQAQRQPGSSFKPIVYATALENGLTPASILVDAPFCVWQGARLGQKCFRNFDHSQAGPKTLRWGVEQSRNLMTIRAASDAGMAKVTQTARELGVGDYPNLLSIALGAGDTTVMKLTNAYAILANHGREVRPSLVDYVQDRNGKVIYRTDGRCATMEGADACNARDWNGRPMPRPPLGGQQLVDAQAAFQMVHVLEGVIQRGTATVLRTLDRPIFGKTGTTSGPTNVWFVGGTPQIVAGVYLGYDQPRAMGGYAQGGRIAAPIFGQFAKKAFADLPKLPFAAPAGIRMARIDRVTGRRVYGSFPMREDPKSAVIWEAFRPDTEQRRSYRRFDANAYFGTGPVVMKAPPPGSPEAEALKKAEPAKTARSRPPRPTQPAAAPTEPVAADSAPLQNSTPSD